MSHSCCDVLFQNSERKHRTEVFVLVVTEELPEWEDAKSMGRV
jgi:diphosphoinositol-polyphosphate diphosphatase